MIKQDAHIDLLLIQLAMTSSLQPWALLLVLLLSIVLSLGAPVTVFSENFVPVWGADGYHLANQGTEVSLTMDRNSGTYRHFVAPYMELPPIHIKCHKFELKLN